MNYERAKVFFSEQKTVHVSKKDGVYYNGLILEVAPTHFYIQDKDGKKLILFKELAKDLEEYTTKEEYKK